MKSLLLSRHKSVAYDHCRRLPAGLASAGRPPDICRLICSLTVSEAAAWRDLHLSRAGCSQYEQGVV